MNDPIQNFYTIGTIAIIAGSVWKFFDQIEKVASDDARSATSAWLRKMSLADERLKSWPATFVSIFDTIFGDKHLSWRCYSRAILASVSLSFCILLIIGFPTENGVVPWRKLLEGTPQILWMVFVNIHTDYLSLLETRYVLKWACKAKSSAKVGGVLLLDFLLSNLIFLFTIIGFFMVDIIHEHAVPLYDYTGGTSGSGVVGDDLAIIFYVSTFFTSLWLWLYAASGLLIRVTTSSDRLLVNLKHFLDIESKPFLSIGVFIILVVTTVLLIVWVAVQVFRLV